MKKFSYIFGLMCVMCVIVLSACGGKSAADKAGMSYDESSAENASDVEAVYLPGIATSENAIIALSESLSDPTIQNTEKGCEITFHTAEGKQVFLVPLHYKLDMYAGDQAAGDDNKFFYDLNPLVVFEKGEKYFPNWQVRQSFTKGITLALPYGKFLTFLSLGTCNETEQLADNHYRVQDRTFNTTKQRIKVKIINVNRFGNARHYISPIYYPVSSKQYSTAFEAKDLMGNTIKGQYVAYQPADY